MNIGTKVSVHGVVGTVKFLGPTQFAPGSWVGVELDSPDGKNDGSVQGVQYFDSKSDRDQDQLYGLFVREGMVQILESSDTTSGQDRYYGALGRKSAGREPSLAQYHQESNDADQLQSRARTPSRSQSPSRQSIAGSPSRSPRSPTRNSSANHAQSHPVLLGPPPLLQPGSIEATASRSPSGRSPSRRLPSGRNLFNTPATGHSSRISSAMSSPSRSPSLVDGGIPSNLSRQVETLKSKLKIMERKRQEDREKLQFMQSQNKSVGRLENIIKRLQLKLTPMHEEIQALRTRLAEAEEINYTLSSERSDEALELATIDREIAEERSENIALELESLQRKFDQLQAECEILREENGLYSSVNLDAESIQLDNGDRNTTNNSIITLEKRNEKLEEALVKLRNISLSQEATYKEKILSLEQNKKDFEKSQTSYERTNEKLAQAENAILDLKQQLDSALGAEDMIESLTEQNLELSEKCEELQSTIDELETLKELNDELEANHSHREKQLLAEIDGLQALNRHNRGKLDELDERNGNLDLAIVRFRELVTSLNTELANQRSSTEQINDQDTADHTRAIIDLNFKLASSSIEYKARTMDLELHRFNAQQALEQLEIMKCYLPNEFSSDETSVRCIFLIEKIAFQSSLICSYYKERIADEKDKNKDDNSNYSFATHLEICLLLIQIQSMTTKLGDIIRYSASDKFQSFSGLYDQVNSIEKSFTSDIGLLRKGDMSDIIYLKSLKGTALKVSVLSDNYEADSLPDSSFLTLSNIQLLLELLNVSVLRDGDLKTLLHKVLNIRRTISRLVSEWKESREEHNITFALVSKSVKMLSTLEEGLYKILRYILKRRLLEDENLKDENGNDSQAELVGTDESSLNNQMDKVNKVEEHNEHVPTTREVLIDFIDSSFSNLDDIGTIFSKSTSRSLPSNPWTVKELQIKELRASQQTMDKELEELKFECQKLATLLRAKDRNIEELDVKVGILNSKLAKSKEQDKLVAELRKSLSDSVTQGKFLNDTVVQLKKTTKEQERLLKQYKKSEVPGLKSGEILSAINLSALSLQREVTELRSAVAYLSKSGNKPRDKIEMHDSSWLEPLPEYTSSHHSALYKRCRPLFKDLRKATEEYNLIAFVSPVHLWKSRKHSSKVIYLSQTEMLQTMQQDMNNILNEI